ncbi:hypothetical protein [Geodermatophilus sp. DSM 44513]|uniref:hypothetical protein n=1 Tax=Geodermatophilus sp. DSM 44513 TaxID=1528104 RepID=UPI00126DA2BA|nr:hypothetical protein [Geodermatophilus sp. DSM 44513]WNV75008.1 hypothetical protein RTG05_18760 [Geodermatophilus sp. DSM 44513]
MAFVLVLIVAVAVVVLVLRAAERSGARGAGAPRPRPPQRAVRPVAPDDDPEFLRELERRTRRDDGSPA